MEEIDESEGSDVEEWEPIDMSVDTGNCLETPLGGLLPPLTQPPSPTADSVQEQEQIVQQNSLVDNELKNAEAMMEMNAKRSRARHRGLKKKVETSLHRYVKHVTNEPSIMSYVSERHLKF